MKDKYIRTPESDLVPSDFELKIESMLVLPTIDENNEADQEGNAIGVRAGKVVIKKDNSFEPIGGINSQPIQAPASAQIGGVFTLVWDAEKKSQYGDFARDFAVWQNQSRQIVPISYTLSSGDQKPNAYLFTLDNIDTIIYPI